ncbi:hypothetical protein THRCLA_08017 [Thraustotheca clavata]|uniref:Fido domain-containing protein n=1 Tax=Thraustotheca clavata TaxID=74557 RepID=A0A1V9ZB06_9STRA|nr:hypothetical protein THRCLA_08017 [Thraustotheca clavata]
MDVPPTVRDTTALCWAAGTGDKELLQALIERGADVNLADYDQRTPLHIAASDGNVSVVEMLLKAGANAYKKDRWGATPLDCAKDPTIVGVLAQFLRFQTRPALGRRSGPKLNDISTDITTVFSAVQLGDTETIKRAWLDGMAVDVTNNAGQTALHVAVENEQLDVIELLLSAGAKPDTTDQTGRTPMSIAVDANAANIIDVLRQRTHPPTIEHPFQPGDNHMPLAFEAIKRSNLDYLVYLVPKYVHPDVQDYDARALLHVASSEGNLKMCQYLVECGANVNALDRWGSSPLSEAMYFAHHDVARYLRAHHAIEHGHVYDESLNQVDPVVLDTALEHVLRTVCRDKWYFGETFIPIKEEDSEGCAIILHSVWYRTPEDVDMTSEEATLHQTWNYHANGGSKLDPITLYRKARGLMLLDPGQDHVGRVYSGQVPEWISNLPTLPQSKFFFAPYARKAGIKAVLSVPMVVKLSIVAVLSWYSFELKPEDPVEIQRIQRFVKAVTLLCSLKHDSNVNMSRYQYCYTLESALTGTGELLYPNVVKEELILHDTVSLALSWHLFDYINKIATSMSSEDHWAVANILSSLVALARKGLFDDVLSPELLELKPSDIQGSIESKTQLMQQLFYYLSYLVAVSPTEGDFFSKIHHIYNDFKQYVTGSEPRPVTPPPVVEEVKSAEEECILCKYKVSGHIHRGKTPPPTAVIAPATPALAPPLSIFRQIPSPVLRELEQLPRVFAEEFEKFGLKAKLANRAYDGLMSTPFTMSDVYDALGSAHDRKDQFKSATSATNTTLLSTLNTILVDKRGLISYDQLMQLHQAIFSSSAENGGIVRDHAAVGYASERIYRVFLPAEEIPRALQLYVSTVNSNTFDHPLLAAYYAFAALVFFIHPFYDGNGRSARLLGNLVARKSGFPSIFRHVDKTLQLLSFLETAVHTMDMQDTVRRSRMGRLAMGNKTTSTWF